jgi:hypothetical protein
MRSMLKPPFFNFLLDHRKQALVVLKDERRSLDQDTAGLFNLVQPVEGTFRARDIASGGISAT